MNLSGKAEVWIEIQSLNNNKDGASRALGHEVHCFLLLWGENSFRYSEKKGGFFCDFVSA